jgi:dihydroorotase
MRSLLLTGGRIIDPANGMDATGDLLIVDGKIAGVGGEAAGEAPTDVERLDVAGCVVSPGLIDVHVHFREPGQSAKETLSTGAAAAARGGFTTVVCMPNTLPAVDTPGTVALIREKASREARVRVLVAGAITRGLEGQELAPIGSLKQAGVVAITDDGRCVQNNELMRRALEYSNMFGLVVMDHCQDYSLVTDGMMHEGYWSTVLGLRGWPAAGEEMIVGRNILLAQLTRARVHCQHVTSAESVRLIRTAKERGLPVSGEACPHHFVLTDSAVAGSDRFWETDGRQYAADYETSADRPSWPAYDTNFKMNPPLRSAEHREAILEGLADGTLEVIASDHAPHCNYEKEVEFDYAPFGVTGLETEVGLSLTQLYHSGRMPLSALIARFTTGPARLLGLPLGSLGVGQTADVTVMDVDRWWTFRREESLSRSHNSPFYGWRMRGKVKATIVGGERVWADEGRID